MKRKPEEKKADIIFEKLNAESKKLLNYYSDLGYDFRQSFILSTVFYGNEMLLCQYVKDGNNFVVDYFNFILENIDKYSAEDICQDFENLKHWDFPYQKSLNDFLEQNGYRDLKTKHYLGFSSSATIDGLASGVKKAFKSIPAPSFIKDGLDESGPVMSMSVSSVHGRAKSAARTPATPDIPFTDNYETYDDNKEKSTLTSSTSTIRMTCNTASVGNVKKYLDNNRSHIDKSMVRTEEFLNYFSFDTSEIKIEENKKFGVSAELCDKPFSMDKKLLLLNIRGKKLNKKTQNITILLDVSGSMATNTAETQQSVFTIIGNMNDGDKLSLVTYSGEDNIVFKNLIVDKNDLDSVINAFYGIHITGCTNGSAGIETAYSLTEEEMKKSEIKYDTNRVVLITDGDLNFGITSKGGLKTLIEKKKESGIFLSVIGTGTYNTQDDKLETLSKNGNGNYCSLSGFDDVNTEINHKYQKIMFTLAKDVKGQIEFNPKFIKTYKLIGYENRQLSHEEFKDDTVISEPFGMGDGIVLLYELTMSGKEEKKESEYKYQTPVINDSDEYFTIKIRYKEPLGEKSEEEEFAFTKENILNDYTENLKLAVLVYTSTELLKGNKADIKLISHCEYLLKNGMQNIRKIDDNEEKLNIFNKTI